MVIEEGFEPSTHSLEGCCSIQLSYGTIPPPKRTANIEKSFLSEAKNISW